MSPAKFKVGFAGELSTAVIAFTLCMYASSVFAGDVVFTKPIDTLTAYRERPLFAPNRRAEMSAPPVEMSDEPVAAQLLNAVLLGVVSASDGSGLAVLRVEGEADAKKLRIGESINGWQLDRVESHSAVFSSGGLSVALTFPIANTAEPSGGDIMQEGAAPSPGAGVKVLSPLMPKQIINP